MFPPRYSSPSLPPCNMTLNSTLHRHSLCSTLANTLSWMGSDFSPAWNYFPLSTLPSSFNDLQSFVIQSYHTERSFSSLNSLGSIPMSLFFPLFSSSSVDKHSSNHDFNSDHRIQSPGPIHNYMVLLFPTKDCVWSKTRNAIHHCQPSQREASAVKWRAELPAKREDRLQVPPRFELGSLDSESRVTPWNPPALIIIMQFVQISPSCDRLCLCFKNSQRNPCASSRSL